MGKCNALLNVAHSESLQLISYNRPLYYGKLHVILTCHLREVVLILKVFS